MKMAKASERDIDAAGELMALLNTIADGYYPAEAGDEDAPTFFDEDDKDHLRLFYDKVKALLDRAPGFPGRVIGSMCYVIMYDQNEIIDPNADVIELHPKLQAALESAERVKELERQLAERDAQQEKDAARIAELEQQLKQCIEQSAAWAAVAGKNDQDAARYRLIRSGEHNGYHLNGPANIGNFQVCQKVRDGEGRYLHEEYLDRATDAALSAQSNQGEKDQ